MVIRKVHPQTEEYWGNVNPVGPRGVYDEAKRLYGKHHKSILYFSWCRNASSVYSILMVRVCDWMTACAAYIHEQALRGEDVTVYGDGFTDRSFCYVDDLVDGILPLLLLIITMPVNIGNLRNYIA